jgi:hypothetical protein
MAKKPTIKQREQSGRGLLIKEENRKANERQKIKDEIERLDRLDVESAKNALNTFLESPEWIRYGCRIVVQGQFMENQIKSGLLVVKNK